MEAFLLEDYKQKIGYLTAHMTRMWTRFNFFITIESALIGGKFLIASNTPSQELAIAGILISALWYVMGAQDRYLVKLYRWQVDQAGDRIARQVMTKEQADSYDHVGRVDNDVVDRFEKQQKEQPKKMNWLAQLFERASSWRSKLFSITHLAAFYPLVAVGLWIFILLMSKPLP